ncbi:hypothetical protein NY547_06770 [Cnuibacter physcomitrellae]|uniref:hypothetical protein n=1 Tax=Cnuibacter physcomitrellae TaxID=1619308 RepID=UPI002176028F|nr:hypothetical protein [Cnuibacter physcomitrellae]MCS5496937.1 hypothetical protein [Cnuibacter physcomitrellae]
MHPEITFDVAADVADDTAGLRLARRGSTFTVLADGVPRVELVDDTEFPVDESADGHGMRARIVDQDDPIDVVAPVSATLARSLLAEDAWMYWLRDQLTVTGPSPLAPGRWRLRMGPLPLLGWRSPHERPAALRSALVPTPEGRFVHGESLRPAIVPLHRLPGRHSAAVLTHRSLLRDHRLPPVLVWHLPGIETYLVLDGHTRLVAALAADAVPAFATLTALPSGTGETDGTGETIDGAGETQG